MILRHPDSILVGHSLGAVLIARLLTTWPNLRVRAALLVAPAETAGDDRIGHFGPVPELRLDIPTVVVASRNDPWMRLERARHPARAWNSDLVDLGQVGHINVDAGFGPWSGGKQPVRRCGTLRRVARRLEEQPEATGLQAARNGAVLAAMLVNPQSAGMPESRNREALPLHGSRPKVEGSEPAQQSGQRATAARSHN